MGNDNDIGRGHRQSSWDTVSLRWVRVEGTPRMVLPSDMPTSEDHTTTCNARRIGRSVGLVYAQVSSVVKRASGGATMASRLHVK